MSCLSVSSPEDVLFGVEGEGGGFLWDSDFGRIRRLLAQLQSFASFEIRLFYLVPVVHCDPILFHGRRYHWCVDGEEASWRGLLDWIS